MFMVLSSCLEHCESSPRVHHKELCVRLTLLARDSMLSALYAQIRLSVRLSVCPSHGWISRKWLKLGSCNF